MNKIVSIKRTSVVFLAIVLVGVIGEISSPFDAFAQEYGFDSKYPPKDGKYDFTAFGQELEYDNKYPPEYPDKNNYYYNSYEPIADYEMDNNYKKSYGKDNYEPEYQSYGKDNYNSYYKSTKDNTIIKKINCINPSVNIKGDNSGDISIGKYGQVIPYATAAAAKEYEDLGASSFGGGERYNNVYDEGFYKKDKDFGCIINNNINQVIGGDDSTPCEKCFSTIKDEMEGSLEQPGGVILGATRGENDYEYEINSIEEFCKVLEQGVQSESFTEVELRAFLVRADIDDTDIDQVVRCLEGLSLISPGAA